MKKLLLTATVAALSATAAQAAPTVYGKAFVTFDINQYDTTNTVTQTVVDTSGTTTTTSNEDKFSSKGRLNLNSNGSRIGFKGSEALSANTDLVYQLEYGIDVDADTSANFRSRDTYVGFANKQFGTLLAGRLTAIDGMVDYANVTAGGVLNDLSEGPSNADGILASIDARRANNTFAYISPDYNGVKFLGMYVMDEANSTNSLGRDGFGVGMQYEPADLPFKAGVTYIQAGDLKATRVSANYQVTPAVGVGALYQNTNFRKDGNKENALTVSGTYGIANTAWTTYAQFDMAKDILGNKGASKQRVAVGGKYAFGKQTTGHVYGAYLTQEASRTLSSSAQTIESKLETSGIGVGAGLEYKF